MKLVQMPADLVHIEDADLDGCGVGPSLLAAYRAYLPPALVRAARAGDPGAATNGARHLLMLLARRIGAALRDENIRLRERGGDLKAGRQKLCYLPGHALCGSARWSRPTRQALTAEAACFLQDLDEAWQDLAEPGTISTPVPVASRSARDAAPACSTSGSQPAAPPS